ncbi:cytochrome c3 family protein [Planctobacterium marinum]|uniref:Doubled CXXCH motif domain-containing protein n=1 Tax=Planctobacterium marinum TaxID=1631968 RepID=A0AA48HLT7_9ALTE|nr:hypothetical protein MACH26_31200 [Planctobacterium marinum]
MLRFIIYSVFFLSYLCKLNATPNYIANEQGYVDSQVCASCHVEHSEGFKGVGMSRSFANVDIKWFSADKLAGLPFYHAPSNRYYDIVLRDNKAYFVRYQLDYLQQRVNEIQVQIDYLLGSGNKVVSPLFRTANDEIYMLPINWYTEGRFWEMAPGFESSKHFGLSRQILRECMFCHNAYPFSEMEQDSFVHRDTFPKQLPQGIDCQRCHGPGENHLEAVFGKAKNLSEIRNSIVNPAKLPVRERDSVCFQCHMLPAVNMVGVRRFERGDYSFRPGETLSDYILHVDTVDANVSREQRFEINHHGYRLSNSACFTQSQGELTCISCHNPHHKPAEIDFVQQVDATCLGCHEAPESAVHNNAAEANKSCVNCHMPQRRAQDVIHVVMTDHRIGIYPDSERLTEPYTKLPPDLIGLELHDLQLELGETEGDIYRLVTILKTVVSAQYAKYLKSRLQQANYPHVLPYIILAETQMKLKDYQEALGTINYIRQRFGEISRVEELKAISQVAMQPEGDAEAIFDWLIKQDQGNAELYFNYGLLKYQKKQYQIALVLFEKAGLMRENFANAVIYEAFTLEKLKRLNDAIEKFRHALQIDPLLDQSYVHLIKLYHAEGNKQEAKRYFQLGTLNAIDKSVITSLALDEDKGYLSIDKND